MKTKRIYKVKWEDEDREFTIDFESDLLWYRIKQWAFENKIAFEIEEKETYEEESYSEDSMNSNGGYEKPFRKVFTIHMHYDWVGYFFKSITWFSWTRK